MTGPILPPNIYQLLGSLSQVDYSSSSTPASASVLPSLTTGSISQSDQVAYTQNFVALQPQLPPPTLSLADYLNIVFTNINKAIEQLHREQVVDDLRTQNQHRALALEANALTSTLAELKGKINKDAKDLEDSSVAINNLGINTTIDTFNSGRGDDGDARNAINDAINKHNEVPPTISDTDFQAAIDTWNAYVAVRNAEIQAYNASATEYNNQANKYNSAADSINELSDAAGQDKIDLIDTSAPLIPLLPTLPPLTPTQTYSPITGVPSPSVDHVEIPAIVDGADLFTRYYVSIADLLIAAYLAVDKQLENVKAFDDFLKFFIQFLSGPTQTASIVDVNDKPETTEGSGSSTFGASFGFKNILAIMNRINQEATVRESNVPFSEGIRDAVAIFGFVALQFSAASAALPAAALLGERFGLVDPGGVAMQVALSSQFLTNVLGIVRSSDFITNLSIALQTADSGLTPDQALALATQIAPGLSVSLVSFALFNLSTSLGLPGLLPQLLANVAGLSTTDARLALSGGLGIPLNLNNSASLAGEGVAARLGLDSATATSIIQGVLDNLPANATEAELREALIQGFSNLGSTIDARKAANTALSLLIADRGLPLIDARLPEEALNLETIRPTIVDTINLLGYPEPAGSNYVNNALAAIMANDYSNKTLRDIRDDFNQALINQGVSASSALTAANQLASSLQSEILQTNVNSNILSLDTIRQDVLRDSLVAQLQQQNIANADELANQVLSSLNGQRFLNEQQLQDAINSQLLNANIANARNITNNLAIVRLNAPGVNPLFSPNLDTILNPSDLALNLNLIILTALTPSLGLPTAQEIAQDIVLNLVGSADENRARQSASDILSDSLRFDQARGDDEAGRRYADTLVDLFIRPNYDVFQLAQRLMDPANNILLSSATSISVSQPQPRQGAGQAGYVNPIQG